MIDFSIQFDTSNKAEYPTCILTTKSGQRIGLLTNIYDVTFKNSCENAPEMALKIAKSDGNNPTPYWDDINMYKLLYVLEMDTYFAIECDTNISSEGTYKALTLTRLAEAELSQIKVYGLQINTEQAIILPDYDPDHPVVLYRPEAALKSSSLLDKILSFAPHYSIGTVDESIRNIQRIFEFNGNSIVDCFRTIAEEESIIFDFSCGANSNRVVNVHDALASCNVCHYRGHFTGTCPECGSTNINEGFGENTGILVSKELLGNNLTITRNPEAIANCYHVSGGDELMTDTIRLCNPNGGYVWSFSDEMKREMSSGLRTALTAYETLYDDYQDTHVFPTTSLPISDYNSIVNKYRAFDTSVTAEPISTITGYSELIKAYYEAIDFGEYLNHSLMPSITNTSTTAADVVAGLTDSTLSPVSLVTLESITLAQASLAVVNYAKIVADSLYNIQVVSQDLVKVNNVYTWVGVLAATNYYDKADTAKTGTLRIVINDNLPNYAQNSVMQTLLNRSQGNSAIVGMYSMSDSALRTALTYYCYQSLQSINDCFVKAVEMLTSIGADQSDNQAHQVYVTTQGKLSIIASELALRENEVKVVDFKDLNTCMTALLWNMITSAINTMKLENNLTAAQWVELNAFRREADFSNDNYVSTSFRKKFDYTDSGFISDSLSNAELIKRAYEFILMAEYKIKENNTYSYNINTSLQNLLVIDEFAALRNGFKVGNWLRVMDESGTLYKLRLIDYEIQFDNLEEISVSFADVSLDAKVTNRMRKFMSKTQDVVVNFNKVTNQNQSNLVVKSTDLTGDYTYSDAYTNNEGSQNIEILNNNVTTKFNVVDGLIEGKISSDQALSLIGQEINKITLQVNNGDETSSITIKYDGVNISTTGSITLGGTVIFQENLTDGVTVISGDNIRTGQIVSANYYFRNGQTFSDSGSLFDLINGNIRTPGLFTNGTTGDLYVKGTIYADAGHIGDFNLISGDNGFALDHVHTAWKLRSAPIAGHNGERYYMWLTENRILTVSNAKMEPHGATNDRAGESSIGSKNYPWRRGYFKRLYMEGCLLGVEYCRVTLEATNWNGNHRQAKTIVGITADTADDTKIRQFVQIQPSYNVSETAAGNDDVINNVVAFQNAGIVCVAKKKNKLTFQWTNEEPEQDIDVYIYVQYARPQNGLDTPYNASIYYNIEDETCYISWSDPDNEMFSVWDHTVLVRKQGSAPTSPSDGLVLATYSSSSGSGGASEKNKYPSSSPYTDNYATLGNNCVANQTPGVYYYTIFAVDSNNEYSTYTDSIYTSDAPILYEVTESGALFDVFVGHYSYIALVYKDGSAPANVNDGTIAEVYTDQTYEQLTRLNVLLSDLPTGDLFFKVFAAPDDDNVLESNTVELVITNGYDFDYTGNIQTFVVPETGVYQIETWGAQGEGAGTTAGGYGGYSTVETILQKDEVLYINVGGQNGYNGGGVD